MPCAKYARFDGNSWKPNNGYNRFQRINNRLPRQESNLLATRYQRVAWTSRLRGKIKLKANPWKGPFDMRPHHRMERVAGGGFEPPWIQLEGGCLVRSANPPCMRCKEIHAFATLEGILLSISGRIRTCVPWLRKPRSWSRLEDADGNFGENPGEGIRR